MSQITPAALLDIDMTRVLLLSQPAIRIGLRMRLKLEPDMTIVGEAGDGLAALTLGALHQPDVVVIEMESVGMDRVQLINAIHTTSPQTAVVILSLQDDVVTRRRMEAAGAAAFVSKHDYGDRLVQAIRHATNGHADASIKLGQRK